MSQENVEAFQRAIDALNCGDVEGVVDAAAEDVVFGAGGGVETDIPTAGVATLQDGKWTRWEDFRDRRRALDAVGLHE